MVGVALKVAKGHLRQRLRHLTAEAFIKMATGFVRNEVRTFSV